MTERFFPNAMPFPTVSAETLGWWEAAARHELVIQACDDCGRTRHPPGPVCPHCRSTAAHWKELPGTGRVYTFTIVRQAFISALDDQLPYVVAALDLDGADEGVRMVSNIVDLEAGEVAIGLEVEVVFEDMGPELALPRFRPTSRR
jgi:uncharacterized OB-fold protein